MKSILLAVVVFPCLPCLAGNGSWVPLFNGENLDGWRQLNGWATYLVDGNSIVGTTAPGSPNSFLCTEKEYGDFEFAFQVKVDPRLNSGVQIRSHSYPEYRKGRVHGYQVEIASNGSAGFIYDEARRGWLSTDRSDPAARQAFKKDQWNAYRVVCRDESIKTWINGVPVANVADSLTSTGFIGLQVHGFKGESPAQVRWRNLRIRQLASKPPSAPRDEKLQKLIDRVEKACIDRTVFMIGRKKAERLAELVRRVRPRVVVECGTAIGYSGLWIARELEAIGQGTLITIELVPSRATEAEGYFKEAGLADIITVRTGNAVEVVKEIKGRVDMLFIDCGYSNYHPILATMEKRLRDGALVVADNVGIGSSGMADYLELVRSKYRSRTEWFDLELPWAERDAMEVTVVSKRNDEERKVQAVIEAVEKECVSPPYVYTIGAAKAKRLAEIVREAKPRLVVECGTALGYSGLWIARELKAAGRGTLITCEIQESVARQAEANFRRAGLADFVTVKLGDARKLVTEIEGPIDFAFIDCNAPNYLGCLKGLEPNLADGATVVTDNVGISAGQVAAYLERLRGSGTSRTEWFDVDLPWVKRDAMEITVIKR